MGLSIAVELAQKYDSIFVIEQQPSFGHGISSRNSEVIHAGIYYQPGSLMAKLCVEGNRRLYQLCDKNGIRYRRIGKIIIANSADQISDLERLFDTGSKNGVDGLKIISDKQIAALEPNVVAKAGLVSPNTGIIDGLGLMDCLYASAKASGADFAFNTKIVGLECQPDGITVVTESNDGEIFTYGSKVVINCAGLFSDQIAEMVGLDIDKLGYRLFFCKGDYFSLRRSLKNLVSRLIYPMKTPKSPGLGVHITIDLDGGLRLGPDAVYLESNLENYKIDSGKRFSFAEAAKQYLPSLTVDDLQPGMSGIRPKRTPPGKTQRDFVIRHEVDRNCPGFINLVGIESPGLTSALAIGKYVREIVDDEHLLK